MRTENLEYLLCPNRCRHTGLAACWRVAKDKADLLRARISALKRQLKDEEERSESFALTIRELEAKVEGARR